MFIEQAYAEAGSTATQQPIWQSIAPLALVIVIFYFLVIRPQQKKLKKHHNMINNLQGGDQILTAGGIFGKVSKLEADTDILLVEIAPEVQVKIKKETVSQVITSEKKETIAAKKEVSPKKNKKVKKKNAKS